MSKVAIVGDLHGNTLFALQVLRAAHAAKINDIYQVGDFGFLWNPDQMSGLGKLSLQLELYGQQLFWVDGNHENFTMLNAYELDDMGRRPISKNIVYLPRGHRFDVDGKTWLALGGATSLDRPNRHEGIDWWPEEALTLGDAYRATEGGKVDVMLTHDCPDRVEIPNLFDGWHKDELIRAEAHRQMMGVVVDTVEPKALFHGHFHQRYDWHRINKSSSVTKIVGLDCDGGTVHDNAVILDTETLEYSPLLHWSNYV